MVLGKHPELGCPSNLDKTRAMAYCLCGRGGGVCLDIFLSSIISLFFFSLSLGNGPIQTEVLSQRAVKPKTTNQPTKQTIQMTSRVSSSFPNKWLLHYL